MKCASGPCRVISAVPSFVFLFELSAKDCGSIEVACRAANLAEPVVASPPLSAEVAELISLFVVHGFNSQEAIC